MNVLIIGGNRFFGRRLSFDLLNGGHQITLLNRGNLDDGLGSEVERIRGDRRDIGFMRTALNYRSWDVVVDQVCFEANEAEDAVNLFRDRTEHYIFTSTQSVYGPGKFISENAFDPRSYHYPKRFLSSENYSEAKKQCEAEFFKNQNFPVTSVRFPIILGEDDYTKRLEFHIRRISQGLPLYFPNLGARHSFLSSEDAGNALSILVNCRKPVGPINISAPDTISMADLMLKIQAITGGKFILGKKNNPASLSPFGIIDDWFSDNQKMSSFGIAPAPMYTWLSQLIEWTFLQIEKS